MPEVSPAYWPIRRLIRAFRDRSLSPTEVIDDVFDRIEGIDDQLHAYITVTHEVAREQAARAAEAYRDGETGPLLGVPLSIKDAFHMQGVETTLGSLLHRGQVAKRDSGVVRRLRAAGAVFTGKTNTAEFGQSATTDNLLGADTANPWDTTRTPGGSSGGAAASVAAGMANVAVGSDGGGSVRIPAAFCGLVGLKPTRGLCPDEHGFRAMTDFVSPGPLAWRVDDARIVLSVLADHAFQRRPAPQGLRIAWCPAPENRPVDRDVAHAVARVADLLRAAGHHLQQRELPISGWQGIFGPLVLDDEHRERGHLMSAASSQLTDYEVASLAAARKMHPATVEAAHQELVGYRRRMASLFEEFDIVLTPTNAVPAFPLGNRPHSIDGRPVGALWGAFPFTAPFNVAGTPAITIPYGQAGGLPIGVQLAAAPYREQVLLDLAEELETAIGFDTSSVVARWSQPSPVSGAVQ